MQNAPQTLVELSQAGFERHSPKLKLRSSGMKKFNWKTDAKLQLKYPKSRKLNIAQTRV